MDIKHLRAKTCTKCGEIKPATGFSKSAKHPTGLKPRCKACSAADETLRACKNALLREAGLNLVSHKTCTSCRLERPAQEFSANINSKDGLGTTCKTCKGIQDAKYAKSNVGKVNMVKKAYTDRHPGRVRAAKNKWRVANPDKLAATKAKRRATELNATPPWADSWDTLPYYTEARRLTLETGIAHHVDHIVPLVNDYVCGLHIAANLQVITKSENLAKSNKFTPGTQ